MTYKIEVLLSCMTDDPYNLVKNMNLETDILVVNQTNKETNEEFKLDGKVVRIINTKTRGLSKSRNIALHNAKGDICLLCDDDVTYLSGYKSTIIEAYSQIKSADVIVFDTIMQNNESPIPRKKIKRIKKSPRHKNYGSVRITFKLESLKSNKIKFNEDFGAGSKYRSGEESLLLRDIRKHKLSVYEYPANISIVDYTNSTWFTGYNEKFFFDKGAWIEEAYPKEKKLYKWYFVFRFKKYCDLSLKEIKKYIDFGIKDRIKNKNIKIIK